SHTRSIPQGHDDSSRGARASWSSSGIPPARRDAFYQHWTELNHVTGVRARVSERIRRVPALAGTRRMPLAGSDAYAGCRPSDCSPLQCIAVFERVSTAIDLEWAP